MTPLQAIGESVASPVHGSKMYDSRHTEINHTALVPPAMTVSEVDSSIGVSTQARVPPCTIKNCRIYSGSSQTTLLDFVSINTHIKAARPRWKVFAM